MGYRIRVSAAASTWVSEQLAGPVRHVPVVHVGPHAIYVAVRNGTNRCCIGVLSRAGFLVPCALSTTLADLSVVSVHDRQLSPGDTAEVGEGQLRIGAFNVRIGRTVNLDVPRVNPVNAHAMASSLRHALAGRLTAVRSELPRESLVLLARADAAAVPMLLGRGSGLTPVGDDVLAGWLATMRAASANTHPIASSVARSSVDVTTLLSATLLDRASSGEVLPEFKQLLLGLRSTDGTRPPPHLGEQVEGMLRIGHTSGAGLLLGTLLALDHLGTDQARSFLPTLNS